MIANRICNISRKCVKLRTYSTHPLPDEVHFEVRKNTQIVTLNRPSALNSLNLNMVNIMIPKYEIWDKSEPHDPRVSGVIMVGTGEKAFCAGGDIKDIYNTKNTEFFEREYKLNLLIGSLKIPHVAIIDGITMGGGVGLSVHGKVRIATEHTVFAMPETAIGFFCDVGGSHFLSRLPHELGMFLGLTGHRLKGKQVVAAGIATHYVKRQDITAVKDALINSNCDLHQIHLHSEKVKLDESTIELPLDVIDDIFSRGSVEEIIAALESRQLHSEFAKKTLHTMMQMSPTSMKIVYRQIRMGKQLHLKDCLDMELRIAKKMMSGNDFFEGVRAMLIDKDKKPIWKPSKLSEVPDEEINKYFL